MIGLSRLSRLRPAVLVLGAAVLVCGLAAPAVARSTSTSAPATVPAQAPAVKAAPAAAQKGNPADYCRGVKFKDVKGERPAYGRGLRDYPARNATCRAYWAAGANSDFVPQAVAIEGHQAWISGYTAPLSQNKCRIMRMNLRTGQVVAQQNEIFATKSDGVTPDYYCRHGGGLTIDQYGMWISASGELWLLNRFAIGYDPTHVVMRHWRVDNSSGISGSLNTSSGGFLMLAAYSNNPATSNVSWINQEALMQPGIDEVSNDPPPAPPVPPAPPAPPAPVTKVPASATQPVPLGSQGLNWYQGLVTTQCGGATLANGKNIGLVPGIEDIEFVPATKKAYIISEASARSLQGGGGKMVPFLTEVSTKKIKHFRPRAGC